jgi:lipid-A-disaccharide synthase
MVSCGEASGDLYAAALTTELRSIDPAIDVVGLGGPRLRAAGADLVGDYEGMAVTGLTEAVPVLRRAWQLRRTLCDAARARRPDVFVAIDAPDFHFSLLRPMHALGVPIVYYISPQLWAWRPRRLETIRRYVDRMLVIFPFETAIYEEAGVPVEFVGHPLVELARTARPRADVLAGVGFDPARPVLALLPGSRPSELRHLLPGLVAAAREIPARVPGMQILVARAPGLDESLFAPLADLRASGIPVAVLDQAADDVLSASDVVVTASGTATVQAALHGRPMVVVYRLSPLSYAMGRLFVRVRTYGMVNLVAGRRIVPELIQGAFTPARVAEETISLLTDRDRAETMRRDLAEVRTKLGAPGASRRAAEAIVQVMKRKRPPASFSPITKPD